MLFHNLYSVICLFASMKSLQFSLEINLKKSLWIKQEGGEKNESFIIHVPVVNFWYLEH